MSRSNLIVDSSIRIVLFFSFFVVITQSSLISRKPHQRVNELVNERCIFFLVFSFSLFSFFFFVVGLVDSSEEGEEEEEEEGEGQRQSFFLTLLLLLLFLLIVQLSPGLLLPPTPITISAAKGENVVRQWKKSQSKIWFGATEKRCPSLRQTLLAFWYEEMGGKCTTGCKPCLFPPLHLCPDSCPPLPGRIEEQ